jgi:hypothetical protein
VFSPNGFWFENVKNLPLVPDSEVVATSKLISEKKAKAKNLYDARVSKFDQGRSSFKNEFCQHTNKQTNKRVESLLCAQFAHLCLLCVFVVFISFSHSFSF